MTLPLQNFIPLFSYCYENHKGEIYREAKRNLQCDMQDQEILFFSLNNILKNLRLKHLELLKQFFIREFIKIFDSLQIIFDLHTEGRLRIFSQNHYRVPSYSYYQRDFSQNINPLKMVRISYDTYKIMYQDLPTNSLMKFGPFLTPSTCENRAYF